MATFGPLRSPKPEPIPIDARAADHLRYIRETMENAAEFTAVPGWGGVAMGVTALVAAFVASRQVSPRAWLIVWLIEAFVAVAIAALRCRLSRCAAGSVALIVWDGYCYGRGVFGARCAGDGFVPHAARRRCSFRTGSLGGCVDGCGLWDRADRIRLVDRTTLWRLVRF